MEAYKAVCAEILKRFMERRIDHRQCSAALYAALSAIETGFTQEDLATAYRTISTNYRAMALELWRRSIEPSKPSLPSTVN